MWVTEMCGGDAGHTKCHPHQGVSDVGEPYTDLKDNLERCRSPIWDKDLVFVQGLYHIP